MIGFTKDVRPQQRQQGEDVEPRMGRITLTSVLVVVLVLGAAIVNQYLSTQ